jgi:hypothetical protein
MGDLVIPDALGHLLGTDLLHVLGGRALRPLHDVELHALTLGQRLEALPSIAE